MAKQLLVFNCGSSSLNYKLYQLSGNDLALSGSGKAHHVGTKSREGSYLMHWSNGRQEKEVRFMPGHREAAGFILDHLERKGLSIDAIGHRFVHGGKLFTKSTLLGPEALGELGSLNYLAPIHNPNSLAVIHLCKDRMPSSIQYATFDTAFHAGMPEAAWRYALPFELADRFGYRKYGFHGLSYQYVTLQASRFVRKPLEELRIVACHLGTGGSSTAAIRGGRSVETSMGYSPLPGLVMSTRCGDLDPSIVIELIGRHGFTPAQVNDLLNKESGLVGLSGESSNLFELLRLAEEQGDQRAKLAVDVYIHRLKTTIGSMLAALGGADLLIFTDDIGVGAWQVREAGCKGMEWCGLVLDPAVNRFATADRIALLSPPGSAIQVLSVPTDEEYVIALEGVNLIR
jgi:acetate kinase